MSPPSLSNPTNTEGNEDTENDDVFIYGGPPTTMIYSASNPSLSDAQVEMNLQNHHSNSSEAQLVHSSSSGRAAALSFNSVVSSSSSESKSNPSSYKDSVPTSFVANESLNSDSSSDSETESDSDSSGTTNVESVTNADSSSSNTSVHHYDSDSESFSDSESDSEPSDSSNSPSSVSSKQHSHSTTEKKNRKLSSQSDNRSYISVHSGYDEYVEDNEENTNMYEPSSLVSSFPTASGPSDTNTHEQTISASNPKPSMKSPEEFESEDSDDSDQRNRGFSILSSMNSVFFTILRLFLTTALFCRRNRLQSSL